MEEGRPTLLHTTEEAEGQNPQAGLLSRRDAKAQALKEEADCREGTGGRSRCTEHLMKAGPCAAGRLPLSTPPSQVPKGAFLIPRFYLGLLPGP